MNQEPCKTTDLAGERNRRILVIDDNRAIHDDFRKILCANGTAAKALDKTATELFGGQANVVRQIRYEIDSAYQGQEGVKLVKQALEKGRPYAMAFVDVRMPPGWDGVETTQRILEIDPDIQIVICTAYADYSWEEMFEKIGNRDGLLILKKPFDSVEAFQLAHALTEKWWLHEQSRQKMEELENRVALRTRELQQSNHALQAEVIEHKRAQQELQWKTAFLEAQVNSSQDGILVVSPEGKKILQNQRVVDLFKIPEAIADGNDDATQVRWVTDMTKNPEQFAQKILHLYSHPNEISRDEIELNDRTVLDRYSSPVVGEDKKYYGRIWTFRDITERKLAEQQLRVQTTALDAAANAVVITDHNGTIQSVNPAFTTLTGYTSEEVVGQNPRILKSDKQDKAFYRNLWQTISSGRAWNGEVTNRRKDGSLYVEEMTITPLRNADGVIARYIAIKQDITGRKHTEEALRESQQMLEGIINAIPVRVFWKDKNLVYLGCNAVFARDAGFADPKDIIGKDDYQMGWRDQADLYRSDDRQVIESGCSRLSIEEPQTTPEGKTITLLSSKLPLRNSKGEISGLLGTYMDITGRKRLEAQLFQSQKLETVGKLAGGVAHEFNSILTAIIGQSELLLNDLLPGNPLCINATEISKAANRAATLTRQLLAYGRKQILQPEILDLNSVVASMEGTLRHLLGGGTDMHFAAFAGLKSVKVDAGQIEQVIMNMVLNVRDAMPNGGKLTLETANVSFDEESVGRYPELKPGDYVMLAITDTGAGMSEEVKARVFEPFFTTKGIGQGTGLGLSTCYGIIKQSGGHISVYSEAGRGATFKIYLPQVEQQTKIPLQRLDSSALPPGTETILLVEDDAALREMAATLLKRLGYTVLSAANGIEALSLKQQRDVGHIDLLFTDVVMPHMSGKELADRVRALYPHTRILFTSAYTENAIVHQGVLDKGVALLQKPFTPSALAHKLREVLDQPGVPKPDSAQTTFGFTRIPDGVNNPMEPAGMTAKLDFTH
jgi:PAS domain S-box-containing protein